MIVVLDMILGAWPEEKEKPFYEEFHNFPSEIILTGFDEIYIGDADGIRLIIDGYTLQCTENPEDGYRSSMNNMELSYKEVKNIFLPCKLIKYENRNNFEGIEYIDAITKKEVLVIGTDYTDDYYPCAIYSFIPENMFINNL